MTKPTMIRITLQITDPETAEAYRGASPEAIAADLLHGSLMTACEVVSVEDRLQLSKWIAQAAPMLSRACEIVVEDSPQRLGEIAGFRGVLEECPVEAEDWKESKP